MNKDSTFDPIKFPGTILLSRRMIEEEAGFRSVIPPFTPMIDPKLLKSDVLQRIVKDAQWEAGNQNLLALSAKASFLTESTQKFEAAANKYQRVATVAIDELHSRGESVL